MKLAALTRNQMISIHVCKKEAGLDTDQKYRDFLFQVAGVRSCKELTVETADKVLKAMGRNVKPKEIIPKRPIIDVSKYSSFKKPAPWQFREVDDKEWNGFVDYMDKMAEKKITVVAVINPDGKKFFKIRPMTKGWGL
jgi:hypothetical protein